MKAKCLLLKTNVKFSLTEPTAGLALDVRQTLFKQPTYRLGDNLMTYESFTMFNFKRVGLDRDFTFFGDRRVIKNNTDDEPGQAQIVPTFPINGEMVAIKPLYDNDTFIPGMTSYDGEEMSSLVDINDIMTLTSTYVNMISFIRNNNNFGVKMINHENFEDVIHQFLNPNYLIDEHFSYTSSTVYNFTTMENVGNDMIRLGNGMTLPKDYKVIDVESLGNSVWVTVKDSVTGKSSSFHKGGYRQANLSGNDIYWSLDDLKRYYEQEVLGSRSVNPSGRTELIFDGIAWSDQNSFMLFYRTPQPVGAMTKPARRGVRFSDSTKL